MESINPEKEVSTDRFLSFKDRFGVQTRDVILIAFVVLLIGAWVIVRGHQASAGLLGRPLRVGIVPWPGYAGGLVANNGLRANKDSDFWRNHNLLVQFVIVPDEAELRNDFARGGEKGGVDITWSTVDSLAQQFPAFVKEGIQPRAFMQADWSRGADAIIASAGIERIEDLRGKKIAVSMSASQWLLEYSLENSSLTSAERTEIRNQRLTTKGSQEARDLFVNGSVDAAVLWEPDVTEAINRRTGANRLIDTSAAANLIADVMVAKEEFIQEHPEVIAAFIRGWLLDGTTKAISNPMLAVKALQEESDFERLGEETTHELLGKVAFATLDDNARMFGLSDGDALFGPLFNEASNLWSKHGYITAQATAEQAQDIRSLREIYRAELGSLAARAGCGSERMTKELSVVFPLGKAELSPEAQRILDAEISLLLRTLSEFRFCVEAVTSEGDDSQRDLGLRQTRETEVIEHLVAHYNLPRSRFVSVSAGSSESASGGRVTQYIRLKLVSGG
jgi:NitT/TauT family transport system substrate-binding protein